MKVVGIVQARMTSTRLPGKVLKEVLGTPLLEYELARLRQIPSLDELVVATTRNDADDPVAALCSRLGVAVYRGSEHDVLSRYYEAAASRHADTVVRFTADCPLIDPALSDRTIRYYLDNRERLDYCSLDVITPPRYPRGVDTEVFSMSLLAAQHAENKDPNAREHVTYSIWNDPARYRLAMLHPENDWGMHRVTVDTQEDFQRVRDIIEYFAPDNNFSTYDMINFLCNAND